MCVEVFCVAHDFYLSTCSVCVCVQAHTYICYVARVEARGQLLEVSSFFQHVVSGVELRPSGFAASVLTC